MPDPAAQRTFALEIVRKLRAANFEALWAGGCVRDQLLRITPKDYDVATSATPDQIRDLFGRRRTLPIGAAFGVVTVLGPRAAGQIEVATFRQDAAYSDGRHPDSVTFTSAEHDAQRRDFTINGLFFDPIAEKVVDFVGGQNDLAARTIRAIGNPRERLHEDKLRMLRAVRFAATFNFAIEPMTMQAIQSMAAEIRAVSAERSGMEMRRMLLDANRSRAMTLLRESGLLRYVLPEIAALADVTFEDVLAVLERLDTPTIAVIMAAILRVALPQARPQQAQEAARRLRFTKHEGDRAAWLLQKLPVLAKAHELPWPTIQRLLIHDGAEEIVALHEAMAGPGDAAVKFCRERLAWTPELLNPAPLLDGGALISHGLKPSPEFSTLLERVRDAQLVGEISTADEAIALVDRLRASSHTLR